MSRPSWTGAFSIAFALPVLVACGGGAAVTRSPANASDPAAPPATSTTGAASTSTSTSATVAPASTSVTASSATTTEAAPLDAIAMLGPFKTLALVCKALVSGSGKSKAFNCLPGANLASPPKGSPIDRAMLVVLSDKALPDASVTHLALHTSAGWYVDPDGPESSTDGAMSKRFRTDVMPDGGPEIFAAGAIPGATYGVRYDFAEVTFVVSIDPTTGKKSNARFHAVRGTTIVCAIGASGAPSCLDPIRTDLQLGKNGVQPENVEKVSFSIDAARWNVDASKHVTMLRAAGHLDAHADVPLSGAYVLHFP